MKQFDRKGWDARHKAAQRVANREHKRLFEQPSEITIKKKRRTAIVAVGILVLTLITIFL